MPLLDLSTVDLDAIASALEDHSYAGSWWIDAETGEVGYWREYDDDDPAYDPEERGDARYIAPTPTQESYGDMEDFIARLPKGRAADLLERAIVGRGAFRRFEDTLCEFPELPDRWFRFSSARTRRRAIEFLVEERLVEESEARRALAEREEDASSVPMLARDDA